MLKISRYCKKGIYENYIGILNLKPFNPPPPNRDHFKMSMQGWFDNDLITLEQHRSFHFADYLKWCDEQMELTS